MTSQDEKNTAEWKHEGMEDFVFYELYSKLPRKYKRLKKMEKSKSRWNEETNVDI